MSQKRTCKYECESEGGRAWGKDGNFVAFQLLSCNICDTRLACVHAMDRNNTQRKKMREYNQAVTLLPHDNRMPKESLEDMVPVKHSQSVSLVQQQSLKTLNYRYEFLYP